MMVYREGFQALTLALKQLWKVADQHTRSVAALAEAHGDIEVQIETLKSNIAISDEIFKMQQVLQDLASGRYS